MSHSTRATFCTITCVFHTIHATLRKAVHRMLHSLFRVVTYFTPMVNVIVINIVSLIRTILLLVMKMIHFCPVAKVTIRVASHVGRGSFTPVGHTTTQRHHVTTPVVCTTSDVTAHPVIIVVVSMRIPSVLVIVVSVVAWVLITSMTSVRWEPITHAVVVVRIISPCSKIVTIVNVVLMTVVMTPMVVMMSLLPMPVAVTENSVKQGRQIWEDYEGRRLGWRQDGEDVSSHGFHSHVTTVHGPGPNMAPTEHCVEKEAKIVSEVIPNKMVVFISATRHPTFIFYCEKKKSRQLLRNKSIVEQFVLLNNSRFFALLQRLGICR